jgi:hypothetical protein
MPPSAVEGIALSLTAGARGVSVEWKAPQDDSPSERVIAYDLRVEYADGYAPADFWKTAVPAVNPPEPGDPGSIESYTIEDPRRARDLFVGILAIDEGGNYSPPAGPVAIHVPGFAFSLECVDVFTGLPIEGLSVILSTGRAYPYTTDSAGRIAHEGELDDGVTYLQVRRGSSPTPYHSMNQRLALQGDSLHTSLAIPVEAAHAAGIPNLLTLFNQLMKTVMTSQSTGVEFPQVGEFAPVAAERKLSKWRHRPVACYIPPFVNPNGVDYEAQARLAAMRWMERTGEPLFELVDAPPDTGIVVTYRPRNEMGIIVGITNHTYGADGALIRDDIWVVNDAGSSAAARLYLIFLHEFGHTIPLGHINDPSLIMFQGQPLPGDISDDEVRVVQLLESLPFGIDMSIYDEDSP